MSTTRRLGTTPWGGGGGRGRGQAYGLRADVGVPHPGVEPDDGRLERVHVRDLDVDLVPAAGVGGVGRCGKRALEVHQVGGVDGLGVDAAIGPVIVDVGQLLGDAPLACGGHCGRMEGAGGRGRGREGG